MPAKKARRKALLRLLAFGLVIAVLATLAYADLRAIPAAIAVAGDKHMVDCMGGGAARPVCQCQRDIITADLTSERMELALSYVSPFAPWGTRFQSTLETSATSAQKAC